MNEEFTRFNTEFKDIEFKMLRKNKMCWVKVIPIKRASNPSCLSIILNDQYHQWDVYDKTGREAHKIYLEKFEGLPSFYLKTGMDCYRVDCEYDNIKIHLIDKHHEMTTFIENNCNFISSQATCWAINIYHTSRSEKLPFNEM